MFFDGEMMDFRWRCGRCPMSKQHKTAENCIFFDERAVGILRGWAVLGCAQGPLRIGIFLLSVLVT